MLDVDTFGVAPRDWLLAHDCLPPDLLPAWKCRRSRPRWRAALLAAPAMFPSLRLHGGLPSRQRAVDRSEDARGAEPGPHFVDFDDSRMGPAVQDLWMLLEGDRAAMQGQLADVLAGYEDFAEFSPRELHLMEALRTLRLLHYSAWLASAGAIRRFRRRSPGSARSATGRTESWNCASRSR